ncbi:hypothetical protein BH10PSE12_BH10PSE12_02640 [soil metagenome]
MDPALQVALAQPAPWIVGAVEILLPGYALRLLDGAGAVTLNGNVYLGQDPAFGVLNSISTLTESIGEEAPEIEIEILPGDAAAAADLANSTMQGAQVSIIVAVIDPSTGLQIGTPEVEFLGEIDVPTLTIGEGGQRTLNFTVVSVFERLFEVDEGVRASDGWHQSIWPGELGLEFMNGTDKNLYWGAKRPAGQQTSRSGVASIVNNSASSVRNALYR